MELDSLKMSLPAIPPLDDTLGAVEIGGVVSTFLFGIGTLQSFYFYKHFPNDSKYLKWLVALLWSYFNALNAATSIDRKFKFKQPQYINDPPHSIEMTILFSAPIYFIVQVFFANRIRILSGQWTMTIICWVLTLIRAVGTFGMLGVALNLHQLSDLKVNFKWLMASALSLGMTVDVLVALSMCFCLWRMRSNGVESTRRMVDNLILWTVETGLATGGASILLLVFFFIRDDCEDRCQFHLLKATKELASMNSDLVPILPHTGQIVLQFYACLAEWTTTFSRHGPKFRKRQHRFEVCQICDGICSQF
ncbi:O-methylsterigmatocystin oxidoreductase [Mycena sanguinolenta]|uniref:O-methylsterigmatocystin oxidoreductase n=1 Tax=Mycena sanguinolenta TaxID=230812 RepID=A0A8H7CTI4_9AGAR|nr:O-methylsterigmatocystin oxidoreductase [Mycena sanguinolenta]